MADFCITPSSLNVYNNIITIKIFNILIYYIQFYNTKSEKSVDCDPLNDEFKHNHISINVSFFILKICNLIIIVPHSYYTLYIICIYYGLYE